MGEAIKDGLKSWKVTSITALHIAKKSSPSMAIWFPRKKKETCLLYLLARSQGHKGILGLVFPLETPTDSPHQIFTQHLHKLQSQSTMNNKITNHLHPPTKINQQSTKIHYQITKPMHRPTKVLDKTTPLPTILPRLNHERKPPDFSLFWQKHIPNSMSV